MQLEETSCCFLDQLISQNKEERSFFCAALKVIQKSVAV